MVKSDREKTAGEFKNKIKPQLVSCETGEHTEEVCVNSVTTLLLLLVLRLTLIAVKVNRVV